MYEIAIKQDNKIKCYAKYFNGRYLSLSNYNNKN